jgi:FkbM family methyltransferase
MVIGKMSYKTVRKVGGRLMRLFGYKISKPLLRNNHILRRQMLLKSFGINKVLDIGANIGQYSMSMRKAGYYGHIISFEPLHNEYEKLLLNSMNDRKWTVFNYALGDSDGESIINVAGNSESSSLLEMLPAHIKHRPNSEYIRQEKITIKKIDSFYNEICRKDDRVFLKIDAQGYEYNIIIGANESLKLIIGIQLEMSLEPLYVGEKPMCEMINYLLAKGFRLMSLEPGAVDGNNGQMFQIDGIFFRTG